VPLLQEHGIGLADLRAGMRAGTGSQPMIIATAAAEALKRAPVTLTGPGLRKLRLDHPTLNPRPCRIPAIEPDHRAGPALRPLRTVIPHLDTPNWTICTCIYRHGQLLIVRAESAIRAGDVTCGRAPLDTIRDILAAQKNLPLITVGCAGKQNR
jgi:hypothetical protein